MLTVGGGLGGMVAFLSPYQGPDTAATVPAAAASGQAINGTATGTGTGLTGINMNSLTGNGSAQGATQSKQATTQGKQASATQNNGANGKEASTQRAGNGG